MGWGSIKLYFMLGLPTETIEDIKAIVDLAEKAKGQGFKGSRGQVNVSVSTFVPKPHTPFQWEKQISMSECKERQELLRKELKKRRLEFKWHDAKMSLMEGVFSRGDRKLAPVIKTAFESGCRFDGWGEEFKFNLWEKAFNQHNIAPDFYLRKRDYNETLPWSHLAAGITEEFLEKEYKHSSAAQETPDCKTDRCSNCGVCDFKVVKNVAFYKREAIGDGQEAIGKTMVYDQLPIAHSPLPVFKIRLFFSKTNNMKYIGHLELMTAFSRAMRRAEIPMRYSKGFHPLPEMVFGAPLPVGIESIAEHVDIELDKYIKIEDVKVILNKELPDGINILDVMEIPLKLPKAFDNLNKNTYLVFLNYNFANISEKDIKNSIEEFLKKDNVVIHQKKDGREREIDIRQIVKDIAFNNDSCIQLTIVNSEKGTAKPHEVIGSIFNIPYDEALCLKILKIKG